MRILKAVIEEKHDGKSVYDFMRRELDISVALVKKIKAIPNGITVNGTHVFVTHTLKTGDALEIIIDDGSESSPNIPYDDGDVNIMYEDEDLLIVSKPSNQPTHPSQGHYHGSLAGIIMQYYRTKGENFVFRPVNRLDKGTSGLMVIAKNAHAHELLKKQLHSGDFIRKYLAVVQGVTESSGYIDAPIARENGSVIKRCVSQNGDSAYTSYKTIGTDGERSLVELTLKTGRTHQIRVHMAYIGHPLTGDFLYGTETADIPRPALHSSYISLIHPINKNVIEIESELPNDMKKLLH